MLLIRQSADEITGNSFDTARTSEKTLAGILWLSDAGGKRWSQRLSLSPHQTRRLNVRELVSAAGLAGQYGGIQFEVPSYVGALDSGGWPILASCFSTLG